MFEEYSDVIMEYLVRRVINVPILVRNSFPLPFSGSFSHLAQQDETPEGEEESIEEWYEDTADVPNLLWAKISTLKLFRHRCLNAALAYTVAVRGGDKTGQNGKAVTDDNGKEKGKETDGEKEKEKAEKIVGPVVKMLNALMLNEGAISEGIKEE